MAIGIPLPQAPDVAFRNSANMGKDFYNMLIQHALQQQQNKRAESANTRAEKIQPFNIKHLLAQTKGLEGSESRAQQMLSPHLQSLRDAHLKAMREADPNYEINNFIHELQMLGKVGNVQTTATNQPKYDALKSKMTGMGQGAGVFPTEDMLQETENNVSAVPNFGGANEANQNTQNPWGIDFNNLNPLQKMVVANSKYKGLLSESPQQKEDAALNLFKKKEEIKNASKAGDIATNNVLTQNQHALQGIDTSVKIIDELLDDKNLPGILNFSPGANAAYDAKTASAIDTLVAAQNLPKVQASIDLVAQQIRRARGETINDYKKRLKALKNDLKERRKMAANIVKTHKINTAEPEDFTQMSDEELARIAAGG